MFYFNLSRDIASDFEIWTSTCNLKDMELTFIYRACFLVVFNIILFKGQYCYVLVCYGNYNYRTARFEYEKMEGRMVTMDTVDIYKDLIFENTDRRGKHKQKFWLQKMQGLSSSKGSSFTCNTELGKCQYVQMTNNTILCEETYCNRKFHFLCEKDEQQTSRHWVTIFQPLINASTEYYDLESSSMNNSYTIGNITETQNLPIRGNNSNILFVLTIVISIGLSVILLLSTIPILKRRLVKLKGQNQNHSMMDEDGYQEIYFKDHFHMKSVQRISIKSLTHSSMLRIKEEPQEDTTADKNNVYSKFSVQSSVYNKLERGRKMSRKNNTSDPDIYSTMNATLTMDLEVKETKDNNDVVVVGEGKTPIAKEDDCSNIASCGQNGQYYPIKEVSKVKESDNSALTDDTQIPTAIKSSPESPKVAVSGGCYELAKTFPGNDWKIQSCERLDYEMAKNLPMNGNDTKSKSCRTLDYEMARL